MSFDDLPPQAPLNPAADLYGAECLARSRAALAALSAHQDISYGDDYWQKLDVFGPLAADCHNLPVLLFFHGGGWTHGYKEWCSFMAPALVTLPALLVSASYRLLPEVNFPAPFDDAFAALAWVERNIERFGGSRERIHVGGHSAGGQLASMLAVRPERRVAAGLPRHGIKGCFCISTTFNRRVVNPSAAPHLVTDEAPDEVSCESSLAFASQADVPFLITWGGMESPRYETFSRLMADTLRQAGCQVATHCFEACGHFDIHLNTGQADDLWTRAVRSFMHAGRFEDDFDHA